LPNLQWETWWLADGATQNKNNLKKAADRWARIAKIAYIRSYIRFTFLFYTWIARSSPSHTKHSKQFKRLFFLFNMKIGILSTFHSIHAPHLASIQPRVMLHTIATHHVLVV
jgi:hypothetical protein